MLGFVSLVFLFVSCKKLKVENFELVEDCDSHGREWLDTLRQPDIGIHYVALDTSKCLLIVKYDKRKANISWIDSYLKRNNLNFVSMEIISDSTQLSDTLGIEVMSSVEESKNMEQKLIDPKPDETLELNVEKEPKEQNKVLETEEEDSVGIKIIEEVKDTLLNN